MGGDWMAPFHFLNYASGSDPHAHWPFLHHSDSPSTTASGFRNRNRAFPDVGSRRQPKVTTIPVQDGNVHAQKRSDKLHPAVKSSETSPETVSVADFQNTESTSSGKSGEVMSNETAATLIQSHFRGFLVRRTAPLTNLRIISSITSQIRQLKAQISTDDYVEKLRLHPKEHLKLSEGIMNLLLRLDSLQGVHATVREIRKSAVREAVALQETIDSKLQQKISETPSQYSKALPTTECNGCVNTFGNSFPGSCDQDTAVQSDSRVLSLQDSQNRFEHLNETISEDVGGRAASDVLPDAEDKTARMESVCYDMESKQALERNENNFVTSAFQEDKTDELPRDNPKEHEAEDRDDVSCSDKRMVESAPTSEGDWCHLEHERTSDVSPDSCVISTEGSDTLETLQKENEELKRILKRCRLTNQQHTSLICNLTERLSMLERQLEDTTKSTVKCSSKCKKKSKRADRVSERRSSRNRTRNRARQSQDFWLEEESCKVWTDDDDKQDKLK